MIIRFFNEAHWQLVQSKSNNPKAINTSNPHASPLYGQEALDAVNRRPRQPQSQPAAPRPPAHQQNAGAPKAILKPPPIPPSPPKAILKYPVAQLVQNAPKGSYPVARLAPPEPKQVITPKGPASVPPPIPKPAPMAKPQSQPERTPLPKPVIPPNQSELLSQVHKQAMHADLHDAMRAGDGTNLLEILDDARLDPKIRSQFYAHGTGSLKSLTDLLNGGIQKDRQFFEENLNSDKSYRLLRDNSPFVLISRPGMTLAKGGIPAVAVDGHHESSLPQLRAAFPHVKFIAAKDAPQILKKVASS